MAASILTCSEGSLRAEISKRVAHHQHRDLALAFVDRWKKDANDVERRTVAVALQSAALPAQVASTRILRGQLECCENTINVNTVQPAKTQLM